VTPTAVISASRVPTDRTVMLRHYVDFPQDQFGGMWDRMVARVLREPAFRAEFQTLPFEQQLVMAHCALDQVIAFLVARSRYRYNQFGLPPVVAAAWRVVRDFTMWYASFCRQLGVEHIHHEPRDLPARPEVAAAGTVEDAALIGAIEALTFSDPQGEASIAATLTAIRNCHDDASDVGYALYASIWVGGCVAVSPALKGSA
jgi:hypothetical protein